MDAGPPVDVREDRLSLPDGRVIHLRLLRFPGGTLLLWIGKETDKGRGVLDNLSLAVGQTATGVIDKSGETVGQELARKLSTKYNEGRPVYVALQVEAEEGSECLLQLMGRVKQLLERECGVDAATTIRLQASAEARLNASGPTAP